MLADLRHAWRALRAAPGYALAVVCCLALGLGANAAAFGLLDTLLFRPPPGVAAPGRLVRVTAERGVRGMPALGMNGVSPAERDLLAARARTVGALAAYSGRAVTVGGGADARPGAAIFTAPGYWTALGARPVLGRTFAPDDEREGAPPTAVVSERLWRTTLGADPRAVGRTLVVNDVPARVVGVAPRGFAGVDLAPVDVWLPIAQTARVTEDAGSPATLPTLTLVARLRDGVARASTEGELRALLARPSAGGPGGLAFEAPTVRVTGVREGDTGVSGGAARLARWLAAVSALVLLVAAANVAGLALARGVARRRELAVRLALGGGRARIVRQLVVEAALLTAAAAAACVGVAAAVGLVLRRFPAFPALPTFDARQAAVVLLLAVPVVVACGLAPALASTRGGLRAALHDGARSTPGRARGRELLLVGQLALTLVVVAGAGLFLRSLGNALAVDFGFDAEHLVAVSVARGAGARRGDAAALLARLRDRAAALPGVRAAAVAGPVPFTGGMFRRVDVPGATGALAGARGGRGGSTLGIWADEHTLAALGVPLVRGRALTAADRPARGAPATAIVVTEAMARRDWPGRDAVGQCVRFVGFGPRSAAVGGAGPCATVVGVAQDARLMSFADAPVPALYEPAGVDGSPFAAVFVRLDRPADPRAAAAIRQALAAAAPDAPPLEARTVADLLGPALAPHRLGAALFTLYGALALALAVVGLYGVVAYDVARRARELAVRSALGARPGDVARLVTGAGARLALAGGALGIAGALGASRLVTGLLYGVRPADPPALLGASATLALVALAASWLPARRAARVDPAAALRSE